MSRDCRRNGPFCCEVVAVGVSASFFLDFFFFCEGVTRSRVEVHEGMVHSGLVKNERALLSQMKAF